MLVTLLLSGCGNFFQSSDSVYGDDYYRVASVTELQSLNHWLALSEEVNTMSQKQVREVLKDFKNPVSPNAFFYYGALNQKLGRIDGWIRARDAFRKLGNDQVSGISIKGQGARELARILEAHNQSLINWYERHGHLQMELAESVLEREALEQKIEALTDLETVISDRKQQVIETNSPVGKH